MQINPGETDEEAQTGGSASSSEEDHPAYPSTLDWDDEFVPSNAKVSWSLGFQDKSLHEVHAGWSGRRGEGGGGRRRRVGMSTCER